MQHHVQWRRLARVVVTLVTSLLLLAPPVQAGPMATSGQFNVSERGAATYSIPIQVPPGTAGIEPKLALNYNSQGGNGLLGMGWGLSGFSAISHCPKTVAQDGANVGISYDTSVDHRYCLDGQRLIAISGSYGGYAEYRTERDSFTKVISFVGSTNNPYYFQVWTKSGQIMEYGHTTDSRVLAQGTNVASVWALNKVSDSLGNYQTYTYIQDGDNGSYHPSHIDYTGNANTSIAPNASVQFVYETRPDITPLYLGGALVKNTKRLTNVQTYLSTDLVRDYRLTYDVGTLTKRSRLKTITECNAKTPPDCLPSVVLTVQDGNGGIASGTNSAPAAPGDFKTPFTIYHGDFNGDGIADLYLVGASESYFCPGPGIASSNNCVKTMTGNWKDYVNIYVGDFNGDGVSDLYLIGGANSWFCAGPGIASTNNCVKTVDANWRLFDAYVGNLNGDGISDLILVGTSASYFCAGPGIASTNNCVAIVGQTTEANWKDSFKAYLGDFNGDGIADLYLMGTSTSYFCAGPGIASANNCQSTFNGNMQTSYGIHVGDFNGDGVSDIYLVGATESYFCSGPGVASANNCITTVAANWKDTYKVYVGDFNGDGIGDLYLVGASYSYFCAGPGIASTNNCLQTVVGNWQGFDIYPADYNGDGSTDLYLVAAGGSYWAGGASKKADTLVSMTSGLGATTTVNYAPLTNTATYFKDATATYPIQDIQGPLYVVAAATTSNGIGGVVTQNYRYYGAKVDVSGRGFLGFRIVQGMSPDTNVWVTTEYRQDWPYVGLPATVSKNLPGSGSSGNLSYVANTYACADFATTAGCPLAIGKRYFPYLSQRVEQAWDLNGAALPTVTTVNQFDCTASPTACYGNLTQVTVSTSDGFSKTTTNIYNNDTTNWRLGQLKRATVSSTTGAASTGGSTPPTTSAVSITAVSPNSGPAAGGTTITVTGTGFGTDGWSGVFVGGVHSVCTISSTTSMTCVTPANTADTVDITASYETGTKTATLAGAFTYTSAPLSITSVSPNFASAGGGDLITIKGTGFSSASMVTIGGVTQPPCKVFNDNVMQCNVGASAVLATFMDVVVSAHGTTATAAGAIEFLNTACKITVTECPNHSNYAGGPYTDPTNTNNSNGVQAACLSRAQEYEAWCGTTQPVTASFVRISDNTVLATTTVGTPPPACSITQSASTVAPGASYTVSVAGSNLPAGAKAYWNGTANGVTDATDILAGSLPASSTGTNIGASNIVYMRYAKIKDSSGNTVCTTPQVTTTYQQSPPTCSLTQTLSTVAAGATNTWSITGTNLPSGAQAYWNGTANGATDVTNLLAGAVPFTGSFTNNGAADIVYTRQAAIKDTSGVTVCTTNTLTTTYQQGPTPTCSLTQSATTVAPGGSVTLSVSGSNLPSGAQAYWNGTTNGVTDITDLAAGAVPASATATNSGAADLSVMRYAVIKNSPGNAICTTNQVTTVFQKAPPVTSCQISVAHCTNNLSYTGGSDNYDNSASNQARCMQRAGEFATYCGTQLPVTASFIRDGATVQSTSVGSYPAVTACWINVTACPLHPANTGYWSDNYNNAGSNQAVCLQRASDYAAWCGTTQPVTAAYYYDGGQAAVITVGQ